MLHKFHITILFLSIGFFSACGEVKTEKTQSTVTASTAPSTQPSSQALTEPSTQPSSPPSQSVKGESFSTTEGSLFISGTVKYERVSVIHNQGYSYLNRRDLKLESAKEVNVKLINENEEIVASTYTNNSGEYRFEHIPKNTKFKIRVYAQMVKRSKWDVKVIDNSHGGALYAIEGDLISTGTKSTIRDIKATASNTAAAPFAILDSIHLAMQRVIEVDNSVEFPLLKLNWSVNNIETGTYYDGVESIMISGDQKGDSDEFDNHIIIHEWGHFFENKLSRADNIGGPHGSTDYLDIRVAFGEGFGNALSAIITDDPIYFDTMGNSGWNMNIEEAKHENAGWYSESSIQRILYDLYDGNSDGQDNLTLGFAPLYKVLVGKQKNSTTFTSLFTFIDALKRENLKSSYKIDEIVASENILPINGIYGEGRKALRDSHTLPLYRKVDIGGTINICTSDTYGSDKFPRNNKLNHHKYVEFKVTEGREYTIKVEQSNGRRADPDFALYSVTPFEKITLSEEEGTEQKSLILKEGSYLLDINDANNISLGCFNVQVN